MAQIVICCGGQPTEKDKREIYNLLEFKKRLKKIKKGIDKPTK